ncbi:MAG: helix-turn-helix domain-containing protein [Clostridiales bacterium]|nr:helix-turn-helix domain-containing protein [Clostridiales bacterium]
MRRNDDRDGKLAGQRIRAARKATGLSQEKLGKKIGLSKGVISIFERDARHGNAFKFARLCYALNLDVVKVFNPEEEDYRWFVESVADSEVS